MSRSDYVACLDIGTTKVSIVLAKQAEAAEEGMEVLAHATVPCSGLSRGMVVDIDATVQSIRQALSQVQKDAGTSVKEVVVGLSGNHIHAMHSHGIVPIANQEVQKYDVERVIEAAKAVAIPSNQSVLHVLPQEFVVDDQSGVEKPIGMSGVRLEARVLIITCADSALQNIVKCVERCGLRVKQVVLEHLASSLATLSKDERDLGVCVLDIGGGTTDMTVFTQGFIRYVSVIPVAGEHVTNDIAMALRTPPKFAEEIKVKHGCLSANRSDAGEFVEVENLASSIPRRVAKSMLSDVMEARYQEIFSFVASELRRQGLENEVAGGFVLTGGAANLPGVQDVAAQVFQSTVRVAKPDVSGCPEGLQDAKYTTLLGLFLQGNKSHATMHYGQVGILQGVWRKVKNWLECL